ncbi:MAG: hypothetical protein ABH951_00755 [Patescibacteria group bacterium]
MKVKRSLNWTEKIILSWRKKIFIVCKDKLIRDFMLLLLKNYKEKFTNFSKKNVFIFIMLEQKKEVHLLYKKYNLINPEKGFDNEFFLKMQKTIEQEFADTDFLSEISEWRRGYLPLFFQELEYWCLLNYREAEKKQKNKKKKQ